MKRIVLTAVLLSACAQAKYVEPTGDDAATLILENQGPVVFGYQLHAAAFRDPLACAGRQSIGQPVASSRGSTLRTHVLPGADFTLGVRGTGGGAAGGDACAAAVSFRPAPRERYVAVFRLDDGKCELTVLRQRPLAAGGGRVPERQLTRREPDCR